MPNWCHNNLRIADKDRNYVFNKEGKVDFNVLLPMPESLNVTSSTTNARDIIMYLSNKDSISVDKIKENPDIKCLTDDSTFSPEYKITNGVKEVEALISEGDADKISQSYKDGKILVDNYRKYGHCTWYEWCNDVWGTKWNASDTEISGAETSEELSISFYTAWCPPFGWLKKLIEQGVQFTLSFSEEGGTYGELVSDGKELMVINSGNWFDDEQEG